MYIRLIYNIHKESTYILERKTHRAYKNFKIGATKHIQPAEA